MPIYSKNKNYNFLILIDIYFDTFLNDLKHFHLYVKLKRRLITILSLINITKIFTKYNIIEKLCLLYIFKNVKNEKNPI